MFVPYSLFYKIDVTPLLSSCHFIEFPLTVSGFAESQFAEGRFAKWRCAECCFVECRFAQSRVAEWPFTKYRFAKCTFAKCIFTECGFGECWFTECRFAEFQRRMQGVVGSPKLLNYFMQYKYCKSHRQPQFWFSGFFTCLDHIYVLSILYMYIFHASTWLYPVTWSRHFSLFWLDEAISPFINTGWLPGG